MPVNQVKQGKQVDPDDVNEVPVQAADLDRSVILGREPPFPGQGQEPRENAQSDDHMHGVYAGHDEVEREKNLGMARVRVLSGMAGNRNVFKTEGSARHVMLVEFVLILFAFDAEKNAAEEHGEDEADDQERTAGGLRRPNGEYDGQAAANEHGGVGGAERGVYGFAGSAEVAEVPAAINQIGTEHSADENDFGGE